MDNMNTISLWLRQWVAAIAREWGYPGIKTQGKAASGCQLLQRKSAGTGHPVDAGASDEATVLMARTAKEQLTAALTGLGAINEELAALASIHRILAITAATGAKEAGTFEHPYIGTVQQARHLAARIDHVREGITGVLQPGCRFQGGSPSHYEAVMNKETRQER